MLYEVLHDLDDIITEATDPKVKGNIEEVQNRRHDRISRSGSHAAGKRAKKGVRRVEVKDSVNPEQTHVIFLLSIFFCTNASLPVVG